MYKQFSTFVVENSVENVDECVFSGKVFNIPKECYTLDITVC